MNIKQAKEQIQNAMTAYFTKDKFGNYAISVEKQRPVFLMGPPGIGKTAIMEQIAAELDVALVSYSMTHHTRQIENIQLLGEARNRFVTRIVKRQILDAAGRTDFTK